MKELFKILKKDICNEKFSTKEYFVYGILVPVALIVICAIAETFN